MNTGIKYFCLVVFVFLASFIPAVSYSQNTYYYWIGESGSWFDPNNWSLTQGGPGGAGVPPLNSFANIITTDGKDRTIDCNAGVGNTVTVDTTGTGTITLIGSLSGDGVGVLIGQNTPAMKIIFNQSGGRSSGGVGSYYIKNTNYNLSGGGILYAEHHISISNSVLDPMDGSMSTSGYLDFSDSIVNFSKGSIFSGDGIVIDGGTFDQTGGVVSGLMYTSGTYNLSGTGIINSYLDISDIEGTFNQKGGEVIWGYEAKILGTYNLEGGSLQLGMNNNNNGNFNYKAGTLIFSDSCPFTNNGTATLSGSGIRGLDGNVENTGNWKTMNTTAQYTKAFNNNGAFLSTSSQNNFTDLTIGDKGSMQGNWEDLWFVSGKLLGIKFNSSLVTNISGADGMFVFYIPTVPENAYLGGKTYNLTGGGKLVPSSTVAKLVRIDVKPGLHPNEITPEDSLLPVAILSSADFNANSIDTATVILEGAGPVSWTKEDVNNDGYIDLLLQFPTEKLGLTGKSTLVILIARTSDGTDVMGADTVHVVFSNNNKAVDPSEGTMGTKLSIQGSGFGTKRGKVAISTTPNTLLAITDWADELIHCQLTKPVAPGVYDVTIQPSGPKGTAPIILESAFEVKAAEIASIHQTEGSAYAHVTIDGKYFGTKRGNVYLEYPKGENIVKRNVQILNWMMDSITGESEIVVVIPPMPPELCDVVVDPYGTLEQTEQEDGFSLKAPEIVSVNPGSGSVGSQITVHGNFFGTKKGRVYLSYLAKGKATKRSCVVGSWIADPASGEGDIVFAVPKGLPAGTYNIMVTNNVGSDTLTGGLTIE